MNPGTLHHRIDDFSFVVETDRCADPVSGTGVWVWFRDEPCCDDNGHQYQFYLPLGVQLSTIKDVCRAFAASTHCAALTAAL